VLVDVRALVVRRPHVDLDGGRAFHGAVVGMTYRQGDPTRTGNDAPTHHERAGRASHGPAQGPGHAVKQQCVQGPWDAAAVRGTFPLDGGASVGRTHHGPPGEQSASQRGAAAPRTPQTSDQGKRQQMRSFSKGFAVPIEDDYICGTVVLLRLEDGRLKAQRVDCRTKGCPKCGPRLRQEWARLWSQVMAGETIYRWVGTDEECAKLLRRKVMRGHAYGVIPAPDGERVVYTTAKVGHLVTGDLAEFLVQDFVAMPTDHRQRSLSAAWQKRADCIEAFTSPAASGEAPRRVEFVGILRAGLEHARELARDFGVYEEEAARDGSAFIFRQPDQPLDWARFKRWAGLEEPSEAGRRRRWARKPKAAA
jgi:hypothetical protein